MRIYKLVVLMCMIFIFAAAPPLDAHQTSVPFVLHAGYTIVVRGSIGSLKGLNFIIDTGAAPSVVDARVSHKLGLTGTKDELRVLFARTVLAERVVLPEVNVGPIRATHVEALAQDLSFIQQGLGVRIDALIGLDVLGRSNFAIDYAAGRLRFDNVPDATETWAQLIGPDTPAVIEMHFKGVPLHLLMDTGAKHTVLFESRVQGLFAANQRESTKVGAIGGPVEVNQVQVAEAALGSTPLAMKSVYLLNTPGNLALQIDGFLAVAALKPLRVDFDFERHAVGWKW